MASESRLAEQLGLANAECRNLRAERDALQARVKELEGAFQGVNDGFIKHIEHVQAEAIRNSDALLAAHGWRSRAEMFEVRVKDDLAELVTARAQLKAEQARAKELEYRLDIETRAHKSTGLGLLEEVAALKAEQAAHAATKEDAKANLVSLGEASAAWVRSEARAERLAALLVRWLGFCECAPDEMDAEIRNDTRAALAAAAPEAKRCAACAHLDESQRDLASCGCLKTEGEG